MLHFPTLQPKLDAIISVALLAAWACITLIQHLNTWPPDLSALYIAARLYQSGQYDLIYAAMDNLPAWAPELANIGRRDAATFPYLYPPLWAALFAPLSALSPEQFFNGFYAIHTGMIAASVILAYRITNPPIPLYVWTTITVLLLLTSLTASLALFHNQLQITVAFLILLAFDRYKSGAMITAGTALALAAAIKILPAALGLIFLLDRGHRAAITTAIAGLALLALSILLAGPALHMDFLDSVNAVSSRVSIEHINWNLESLLVQLASLITSDPIGSIPLGIERIPKPLWVTLANYAALIAATALVIHRTNPQSAARLLGFLLILTLTGPLAWIYHYLIVLLLIPMAFCHMTTTRALATLIAFGWLTSVNAFTWAANLSDKVHGQAILGTATMIALLILVVTPKRAHTHNR